MSQHGPVVTFGEIMLRLAPPGYERFLQTPRFEATFGGGEANVAVALAALGQPSSYITVLPENNPLADACVSELRSFGVDTSGIVRAPGRVGIYFVEQGASQRPSRVVYDRANSTIALAKPGDIDWSTVFRGASLFHITGITPAISACAAELAVEGVRTAKEAGLFVSCDLSLRKNLWKWGKPPVAVMPGIVKYVDFLIGGAEDLEVMLGMESGMAKEITARTLDAFPNLRAVLVTMRETRSASHTLWAACLNNREQFLMSRKYEITHIVDRVGSGDSFSAGWIWSWLNLGRYDDGLEFATALSCLKHSVPGDFCRVTLAEVQSLLAGGGSGRVER
jgi:2-dehydro-3-deoxygluconokinase